MPHLPISTIVTRLPSLNLISAIAEPSVWDEYKWSIIGAIVLCIFAALLIVTLLVSRARLRRAEEALRQSEARNHLLRAIPDLMFLLTRDGVYLDYHAKDPADLLIPPSDFLGKNISDTLPPELVERFEHCFRRAAETNQPQIVEYPLPLGNEEVWFEARFTAGPDDKILSVVRNITDRRRVESELRRSEERFAKAFRANPQPMWITSFTDARFVDVNESFLTMSGYTRDEVMGHTALELNIWANPETRTEVLRTLEREGVIRNFETKFRTKSGAIRLLLSSAEDLELGGERCLLVASSDITDRQLADEARARLAALVESSEDAIISKTLDGKITSWNAAAERLYGYTALEAMGQPISMIVPADHADELSRIIQMIRAGQRVQHLETTRRRKNGSYLGVSITVSPIVDPDGEVIGASAIARDITERKRAEEAIRQSEANFRSIFNTVNDAIFVHDWKTGDILDANERAAEMYGFSLEEIKRVQVGDLSSNLPPYTQEIALKWIGKAFAGEPQVFEWRAKDKNGHLFWVEVSLKRVLLGNKDRLLAVVRDITNRKQAEQDLRDLSARLIHSQEEERSRIGRELHDDFNQQLAILSIELQQLGQKVPARQHALRERVQKLWTRAQEISADVHRLSYQLHPFKLDHLGVASAMKSLCNELSGHEGLIVEFQQEGFPANLPGDVTLCVFRIAQESLRNVIKHSGARFARVYLGTNDDAVRLSVSDNGCGFDPDSPTAKQGLGLISMRERLRLVGGVISIRSERGRGTQIDALVPAKSQKELSMSASAQRDVGIAHEGAWK